YAPGSICLVLAASSSGEAHGSSTNISGRGETGDGCPTPGRSLAHPFRRPPRHFYRLFPLYLSPDHRHAPHLGLGSGHFRGDRTAFSHTSTRRTSCPLNCCYNRDSDVSPLLS